MRKRGMHTDLRTQLLPTQSIRAELGIFGKDHKVRIANIHIRSLHNANTFNIHRMRRHYWHTHLRRNQELIIILLQHAARTWPTVSTQNYLLNPLAIRQPRSYAASSIPRELRLGAIRIEQAQRQLAISFTFQKLHTICANSSAWSRVTS